MPLRGLRLRHGRERYRAGVLGHVSQDAQTVLDRHFCDGVPAPFEGACGSLRSRARLWALLRSASVTDATTRSGEQPGKRRRSRWNSVFWIVESMAIAAIPVIVLLLQYSEEGYMRRNGIRVTATVDELPGGKDSCVRCPLVFTIDGERHSVEESLVAGQTAESPRRFFPGEDIELYVDPTDSPAWTRCCHFCCHSRGRSDANPLSKSAQHGVKPFNVRRSSVGLGLRTISRTKADAVN
jgi:hypothetical protein